MYKIDWYKTIEVIGFFITIGTLIFSGYAAAITWQRRRQFAEIARIHSSGEGFETRFSAYEKVTTSNPWVLSINLLDASPSAISGIRNHYEAMGLPFPEYREVSMNGIHELPTDLAGLLRRIREERIFLDQEAATEVHVFVAGPVAAALYIGAALDNWKLVKVFHYAKGGYSYWGALEK